VLDPSKIQDNLEKLVCEAYVANKLEDFQQIWGYNEDGQKVKND